MHEVLATKRRDRRAAPEFLKRDETPWPAGFDRRGQASVIPRGDAGDRQRGRQETKRWFNNRAENCTSRSDAGKGQWPNSGTLKTLQKFAAVHASIHNHFNRERHLERRDIFKQKRAAALAEWRLLAA